MITGVGIVSREKEEEMTMTAPIVAEKTEQETPEVAPVSEPTATTKLSAGEQDALIVQATEGKGKVDAPGTQDTPRAWTQTRPSPSLSDILGD